MTLLMTLWFAGSDHAMLQDASLKDASLARGGWGRGPVRKLIAVSLLLWLAAFAASGAYAVQPDEIMADPIKEARARELSRELRCMVCQNQSIDDSEAPLARDLRLLVRERIAAGDSDARVIDFLVARYGEFVLLQPRFESHTWLLWLLPPLALVAGGLALWMQNRRRSGTAAAEGLLKLTAEEEARLQRLLAPSPDKPV
jgi:cytochrome c-type biogenesis protein CcmH